MPERPRSGGFEDRLRHVLPDVVRTTRMAIRWSQDELERRSGVSQSKISRLEAGQIERLTAAEVARLLDCLGVRVSFAAETPFIDRPALQHDGAHARCLGYVARRLIRLGWDVRTELEILDGTARGWADVVAIDAARRLFVAEVKTALPDFGAAQRQLGWYERTVPAAVHALGWRPASVTSALLLLASDENDERLRQNATLARLAYPTRAPALMRWLLAEGGPPLPAGVALIDPRSPRTRWLILTTLDRRRTRLRYRNYADFMAGTGASRLRPARSFLRE